MGEVHAQGGQEARGRGAAHREAEPAGAWLAGGVRLVCAALLWVPLVRVEQPCALMLLMREVTWCVLPCVSMLLMHCVW